MLFLTLHLQLGPERSQTGHGALWGKVETATRKKVSHKALWRPAGKVVTPALGWLFGHYASLLTCSLTWAGQEHWWGGQQPSRLSADSAPADPASVDRVNSVMLL